MRISARSSTNLNKVFVFFLSLTKKLPSYYNRILSHNFLSIVIVDFRLWIIHCMTLTKEIHFRVLQSLTTLQRINKLLCICEIWKISCPAHNGSLRLTVILWEALYEKDVRNYINKTVHSIKKRRREDKMRRQDIQNRWNF